MAQSNQLSGRQIADLCILTVLGAGSLIYLYDAYLASSHVYNLIFVAPLSVVVFVFCLIEFIRQFRGNIPVPDLEPIASVLPVIGLFTAYVMTLGWLGFDLGTALFIGLFLWFHGERRLPWILAYSIVFAFVTSFFFSSMLPYPMPMLFLPTEY
ncbi:MAG: tripartite tricarboxylate transporter TctB family protein [Spongiibacteraceae bacterium]|nr:tripartite tricarboxylate transporter TctB family protein [Spongiibacteraceae bacterium]